MKKTIAPPLTKVIPKNPKFAHVGPTLKTGAHAGNVKVKVDRSGEIFRRVKRTTLANLMRVRERKEESIYDLSASDTISVVTTDSSSESDAKVTLGETDYIVVDLREPDLFDAGHIEGAFNFPAVQLRRDQCPAQVYAFRNKSNKLIIVYGDSATTRLGIETTTYMVQKDWQNVALLTGEFAAFAEKYPDRIVATGADRATSSRGDLRSLALSAPSTPGGGAGSVAGTPLSPPSRGRSKLERLEAPVTPKVGQREAADVLTLTASSAGSLAGASSSSSSSSSAAMERKTMRIRDDEDEDGEVGSRRGARPGTSETTLSSSRRSTTPGGGGGGGGGGGDSDGTESVRSVASSGTRLSLASAGSTIIGGAGGGAPRAPKRSGSSSGGSSSASSTSGGGARPKMVKAGGGGLKLAATGGAGAGAGAGAPSPKSSHGDTGRIAGGWK